MSDKPELVGITVAELIVEGQKWIDADPNRKILAQLGRMYWDREGVVEAIALAAQRAVVEEILSEAMDMGRWYQIQGQWFDSICAIVRRH